jgi:putative transposase
MGEIAAVKRRYGYRRIHVLLRREGWEVNRKKTYRLYRELGLAVRRVSASASGRLSACHYRSRRPRTRAGRWTSLPTG